MIYDLHDLKLLSSVTLEARIERREAEMRQMRRDGTRYTRREEYEMLTQVVEVLRAELRHRPSWGR